MGVGNCYKCGSSEHTTKNCVSKSADAASRWTFWVQVTYMTCYMLNIHDYIQLGVNAVI